MKFLLKYTFILFFIAGSSSLYAKSSHVITKDALLTDSLSSHQVEFNRAMELYREGKLMDAYRIFENLANTHKDQHEAYYQMALIGYQFGALDVSDQAISNALLIKPTELKYWVLNYDVNRRLQSKEKTIIAMDNVMKLKPTEPELVAQIIFDYQMFEEFDKSEKALQYGEEHFSDNSSIRLSKARVFNNKGSYAEAEVVLNSLIQDHEQLSDAYILLAEVYRKQKKHKKGLEILDRAETALGKSSPLIEFSRADIYREQKKNKRSLQHLSLGLKSPDLDFQNQSTVLMNSLSFYKFKDIEVLLQDYLNRNKENAFAYLVVGDMYLEAKQEEKAVYYYRESLKINPENKEVWNMVLTYSAFKEDYKTLIAEGEHALQHVPNDPNILVLLGSSYLMDSSMDMKSRAQKAREYVEKALDIESNQSEDSALLGNIYALLGDVYQNLEMYAASNVAYEEALKIDSSNVSALNNYAYFLSLRKENLDKALEYSKKTLEFDEENPTFLDTYGWVLYQMENFEESKIYLEKALNNSPDPSVDILHHYGDVLFQLNEVNEAVKYWKKALKLTVVGESAYDDLKSKIENKSIQ